MSSMAIHKAGLTLEHLVGRTGAHLQGKGANNHADYYDYGKGVYDGIAAVLEAIRDDIDSIAFPTGEAGSPKAMGAVLLGALVASSTCADP